MKKVLSLIISAFLLFSLGACNGEKNENKAQASYVKLSESELYFHSSDEKLDLFLNDYYKRHSRASLDYAVNGMELGTSGSCWKDWESMSLLWYDSTTENFRSDSFALIRQWLYSIPVDDYGYVWSSASSEKASVNPGDGNTFGMGWPFPNYGSDAQNDWEFNSRNNKQGWNAESDGTISATSTYLGQPCYVSEGFYSLAVENATEVSYYLSGKNIQTKNNPFLEFDLRWALGGTFENCFVDDIYVSFKTKDSDAVYTVKQSDLTERTINISNLYTNHVYMPMYLNENWGTNNVVTDIRITVKAKTGKNFSGKFWLNFVRANYDSRQVDNIFNYVSALKQYYEFTGDKQVLKDNTDKYRKAVLFMIYNLDGQSGLVDLSKFVGHNGGVIADGVGNTIGSCYWDVLSLSPKSVYAQVLYYRTLEDALFLENALEHEDIDSEWPEIKLFTGETASFALTEERISELMEGVKEKVQEPVNVSAKTGYYDTQKGRFIEGFNMHGDVVDYGSTIFNDMVVSAGMATKDQAKSVCAWINGDRIVEGDNARGYLGDMEDPDNCGIYDYGFAPRVTTKKNFEQYTTGHASQANNLYGMSCQDGGAILFTSYYDLYARFITNGADDAFKRLSAIKDWYLKVYEYSAEDFGAAYFYRAYYDDLGILLQGNGNGGSLGLDSEFLENAIVYSIVPFAFFGLAGTSDGCLSVTPSLPKDLKFWRMENLMYRNIRYDLEIGRDYVLIESVRGDTSGRKIKANFAYSGSDPAVYIDGVKLDRSNYVFKDGIVTVETDFSAKKLEVK